jgi:hypothetical protein
MEVSQAQTYTNLYNVKGSKPCEGQILVIPGNATESVLYRKVAAKLPHGPTDLCGVAMPNDSQSLPEAAVTLIEDWINDGALNN